MSRTQRRLLAVMATVMAFGLVLLTSATGGISVAWELTLSNTLDFDSTSTTESDIARNHTRPTSKERMANDALQTFKSVDTKYLIYMATGGWSNQVICMKNAYHLAQALGRILVTPPVLPHTGKGSTTNVDVGKFVGKEPNKRFLFGKPDWKRLYVDKVRRSDYVSMHQVVDIERTLEGIQSVDFKKWQSHHKELGISNWDTLPRVEDRFSRYNTLWVHPQDSSQASKLGGVEYNVTRVDFHMNFYLNVTYRSLQEIPNNSRVLTFLDALKADIPALPTIPFRLRYASTIREAANRILQDEWKGVPYAAIHLRGSDGSFSSVMNDTIFSAMDQLYRNHILKHLTTESDPTASTSFPIYVATDIPNVVEHPTFLASIQKWELEHPSLSIQLLKFNSSNIKLQFKKSLRHPRIYFDQYIAACATLGFVGTKRSSFSKLISHTLECGKDIVS